MSASGYTSFYFALIGNVEGVSYMNTIVGKSKKGIYTQSAGYNVNFAGQQAGQVSGVTVDKVTATASYSNGSWHCLFSSQVAGKLYCAETGSVAATWTSSTIGTTYDAGVSLAYYFIPD